MQKIKNYIKRPTIYIPLSVIVLILVGSLIFSGDKNGREIFEVKKGEVLQTVSVTGKTKPASYVDLGVEKGGRVTSVSAQVGDKVTKGQILVRLDSGDLYANLLQSKANLLAEEVKLSEMKKGTRIEEIQISEAQKRSAEDTLSDSILNLRDKVQEAYTKTDDAIRNYIDEMFENPRTQGANFLFQVNNFQLEININLGRVEVEQILTKWASNYEITVSEVKNNLSKVKVLLDNVAFAVNSLTPYGSVTQTNIDKYKTSVSSARTAVNLALSNLTTAETSYNSAQSALDIAIRQYELKLSGYTEEAIKSQEARVMQMQAQVTNSEAQISKNIIYTPISGIVTKQDAKVGEVLSVSASVVSVMSLGNFEIEAYVPEVNIGKVKVDDIALVDFDAFVGEIFKGKVIYIEPAETMINNVPNFKIKISLDEMDQKIKSGLTANVNIETAKKTDVLSVPKYAVTKEGEKYFVNKVVGSEDVKTEVTLGLQGDNGYVEVVSGLELGEKVSFSNK